MCVEGRRGVRSQVSIDPRSPTGPNEYRGGDGPLYVMKGKLNNPLHHAFLQAGEQAGYAITEDMNGYKQEGIGIFDLTIHKGIYLLQICHCNTCHTSLWDCSHYDRCKQKQKQVHTWPKDELMLCRFTLTILQHNRKHKHI